MLLYQQAHLSETKTYSNLAERYGKKRTLKSRETLLHRNVKGVIKIWARNDERAKGMGQRKPRHKYDEIESAK